jgi:hypothetical protein
VVENQYFNLALIPESIHLQTLCVELARANCADRSDSYLLGDEALPHVTLCQFVAPIALINKVWNEFDDLHANLVSLTFRHVYVQYGKGELEGKVWVGLAVKYEPALIELQKTVFAKLASLGIEGRKTPENYFPHLTFARCDSSAPVIISAAPKAEFWGATFQFRLTIGSSDEHGRYHATVCSANQV